MFNGITYREFNKTFKTDEDCRIYLYKMKWKKGYSCRKCNYHLSYPGETAFHRRCRMCDFDESVTANTLFHKIKFPLLKAFGIAFIISVRKKGMSTLELSRSFSINQKTAWLFKRKLQEGMKADIHTILKAPHEKTETLVGGGQRESNNKFHGQEKTVLIIREISSNSPGRAFGRIVSNQNNVKSASPTEKDSEFVQEKKSVEKNPFLKKDDLAGGRHNQTAKNICGLEIIISNLRAWLRGIHHHCSERFLQGYLDEFFFRFNQRHVLKLAWHELIDHLMSGKPYFYRPREA